MRQRRYDQIKSFPLLPLVSGSWSKLILILPSLAVLGQLSLSESWLSFLPESSLVGFLCQNLVEDSSATEESVSKQAVAKVMTSLLLHLTVEKR